MERQETKKTEEREAFSELDRDMTIQSQVSNLHLLTSQLYMLQHMSEKHPSTSYPAATNRKFSKLRDSRM